MTSNHAPKEILSPGEKHRLAKRRARRILRSGGLPRIVRRYLKQKFPEAADRVVSD